MSAFEVFLSDASATESARLLEQVVEVSETETRATVAMVTETVLVQSETAQITVREVIDEVVISSDYDTCANPAPSEYALYAPAHAVLDSGMPVYLNRLGGLSLAASTGYPEAAVIGVTLSPAVLSELAQYTTDGRVQRTDWSAIAGSPRLSAGDTYYLAAIPGKITNIPPQTGIAVPIGTAVYDTTLDVEIGQPIGLI
jgi:hypothetical protein